MQTCICTCTQSNTHTRTHTHTHTHSGGSKGGGRLWSTSKHCGLTELVSKAEKCHTIVIRCALQRNAYEMWLMNNYYIFWAGPSFLVFWVHHCMHACTQTILSHTMMSDQDIVISWVMTDNGRKERTRIEIWTLSPDMTWALLIVTHFYCPDHKYVSGIIEFTPQCSLVSSIL